MIRVGRAVCTRINRLDRKLLFFSFMLLLVGRLPALHNFPPAAAFPSRLHSQMPCQSTLNIYHTRSFASRLVLILPKDNAEQSERISTVKKLCKYPPVQNFALSSHKKRGIFLMWWRIPPGLANRPASHQCKEPQSPTTWS
jgi:hypothetical protein